MKKIQVFALPFLAMMLFACRKDSNAVGTLPTVSTGNYTYFPENQT